MKRRLLLGIILCMVLCLGAGCAGKPTLSPTPQPTPTGGEKNMENNYRLIVNGQDITERVYVNLNVKERYAELPLIAVVTALGADVQWQSETKATITFEGKMYFLDIPAKTLFDEDMNISLLQLAPGSGHGEYYKILDGELIVDSDTMLYLISYRMGAMIRYDFEEKIVTIGFEES